MKKLIALLLLAALPVFAGDSLDIIVLEVPEAATNATSQATACATSSVPIYGFLEYVIVDFTSTNSIDVDIDLTTLASRGTGASRTIYSKDDLTADALLPIRVQAVTTAGSAITGWYNRLPMAGDYIKLEVYDASAENVACKVYIIYER